MSRLIHGATVHGVDLDAHSRCAHYHTQRDIVALKFACCGGWYACHACHAVCADHPAAVWPVGARDTEAVLCGACGHRLTIADYLDCGHTCPGCGAAFNPGCAKHYGLYFDRAGGGT